MQQRGTNPKIWQEGPVRNTWRAVLGGGGAAVVCLIPGQKNRYHASVILVTTTGASTVSCDEFRSVDGAMGWVEAWFSNASEW